MFGFRIFKLSGKDIAILVSLVVIATSWSAFSKSFPLLSAVTMSFLMIAVPIFLIVAFVKRTKRKKQQTNSQKAALVQAQIRANR